MFGSNSCAFYCAHVAGVPQIGGADVQCSYYCLVSALRNLEEVACLLNHTNVIDFLLYYLNCGRPSQATRCYLHLLFNEFVILNDAPLKQALSRGRRCYAVGPVHLRMSHAGGGGEESESSSSRSASSTTIAKRKAYIPTKLIWSSPLVAL